MARIILLQRTTCFAAIACALAASFVAAAPHPSVARIVVQEQGAVAYGSGTLIDKRDEYGLVVTNWHVVCDAVGKIEVVFASGFRSQARAIKLDEDWDLAALVIWRPPAECMPMASRPPKPGDPLTICGYGQGQYREATGRCTDFYAPEVGLPHELVELSVEARQGDSGGPILNSRGEMAGVLFGAGQGTTLGSFAPRVESFLATLAPDIGSRRHPGEIPSTPPLIAHAPPVVEDESSQDAIWQSLAGPQELVCESSPSLPNLESHDAAWPEMPFVAEECLAVAEPGESSGVPRQGAFKPWASVEVADAQPVESSQAEAATAAVVAAPQLPLVGPPEWFGMARNLFAVIGVVFLVLQLVRVVT